MHITLRDFATAFTKTGSVFGTLGFLYIAGNAWFHPQTLALPLTHFLSYPREDTSGAVCFVVALLCFFVYNLLQCPKN